MALWTPANLAAAPKLWIDGDDAVFSGSNLTSVSAKGADAGAMIIGGAPTRATLNGLNGVVFDAGGEKLSRSLSAWGTSGQLFCFAVVKPYARPTGGTYSGVLHKGSPSPSGTVMVSVDAWDDGATGDGYSYSTGDGWEYATRGPTQDVRYPNRPILAPTLYAVQLGPTNAYYCNAVAVGSPASAENSVASVPNHGSAQWDFGEGWGGSAEVFNGEIFQLLLFSAWPSTGERQKIEGWAAHKYGLATLLPTGHPYKAAAPTTGYLLGAAQGTFTRAGGAAGLTAGRRVAASAGSFNAAGQSAIARASRRLPAGQGLVGLVGSAVALSEGGVVLGAETGLAAFSGPAATLVRRSSRRLPAEAGPCRLDGGRAMLRAPFRWTPAAAAATAWNPLPLSDGGWSPLAAPPTDWSLV